MYCLPCTFLFDEYVPLVFHLPYLTFTYLPLLLHFKSYEFSMELLSLAYLLKDVCFNTVVLPVPLPCPALALPSPRPALPQLRRNCHVMHGLDSGWRKGLYLVLFSRSRLL